jgi:hypothetical protein
MTETIEKATVSDQRNLLANAEKEGWITDFDLDAGLVFIDRCGSDGECKTFKHTFTMTETKAEISKEGVEVVRTTDFKVVEKAVEAPMTEGTLSKFLDKYFGSSKKESIQVVKQFGSEDDPMYAVEPLYVAPGEVDGHGDTMALEDIESMVESLNKANEEGRLQSGLFHKHKTDVWTLDKAWVNPVECMIGDQLVRKGQPIAKTLFTNKVAFNMRINGDIAGLSIGARAKETIDLTKDISDIQGSPEATRQLVGVNFDWANPELTYTSPSQGGACSLKNEAYEINKAKKATIDDLDEEQASILKDIGEDFISLEKHLGEDNNQTPSSSAEAKVGEDNKVTKGTNMTDVTREEFEDLQKALAESLAVNALSGYNFEADVNKAMASAVAKLNDEDKEAVTKALDVLVARTETEVDKAVAAKPKEDCELSKALSEEVGEGGEVEEAVEKSLAQRALDAQDKMKEAV